MIEIGFDKKCFIIAEAGINHNGELSRAMAMVDMAKESNADAIKFQSFIPRELDFPYPNITYKETAELKEYCEYKGIPFFSTPHSISAIDFLADLRVPLLKVAAPKLLEHGFINHVVDKKIDMLISVNPKAQYDDVEWLTKLVKPKVYFMHTVSEYPCYNPRFGRLDLWMGRFPNSVWGYSDHGEDYEFCLEAVRLYGTKIIEKHFKLDDDCVDSNVSIEPFEFKEMVERIRELEAAKAETSETDKVGVDSCLS